MKYLTIFIIILVMLLAGAGYIYYQNTQSHDEMFDDISSFEAYLRNKEYDKAKTAYENANSTLKANYNITLDTYSTQYLSSIREDSDSEQVLNDLYAIESIGYTSDEITMMIKQYEGCTAV